MDYQDIIRRKRESDARDKESYDKEKLLKIVNKKILTTGVGAVASIEKHLGFLFGHKEYRELTKDEKFFKEKIEALRKEILDNTNKQIKNTGEEFKLYTIVCNGYSLKLPVYKGTKE